MSETRTRKAIDAQIAGAGWVLPPVVYHTVEVEGDFRDQEIKRALGGKRPDYHFYESADSKVPIALLEAKREGGDLDFALEQAKEKAQLINQACQQTVCTVLLASDGRITKSCNHEGVPLTINDVLVDSIPTLGTMLMLKETPSFIDGEQIETSQALVELFEDASKELRRAGIGAGVPSLLEFSRLLFIKIMSEQSGRLGTSARAQWRDIVSSEGKQLINAYRSAIRHWKDTYGVLFQRSILDDAGVIAQIVLRMNAINFKKSHVDVKGSAYEWFLSKHAAGAESGFGQNFTPRHITRAMATILEPNPGDVIYDPFSGTGGMLLACYEEIGRCIGPEDTAERKQKWRKLRKETLFGNEIDKNVAALAQMNMIIIGDGHANIRAESSFTSPEKHWCNRLITNIPFNMKKPTGRMQTHYRRILAKKAIDSNEACLLHCMESLEVDGMFAMIVPETILYDRRYATIREYLAEKCRVRGVIRLPRIVFRPYTTAKTAILVGDRVWSGGTTSFPVIDIRNDGLSEDP